MIFLLLPLAVLASALLYQKLRETVDRRRYPPPGRLIAVGKTLLHLHEQGQGSPVVVFESGIGASSLSWAVIQPKVAAFSRSVSYDRAGLGWSATSHEPRSIPGMIQELRSLLSSAGLAAPFVLVGHSFGGLLARVYAFIYPHEIVGLVLLDPVSVTAWAKCPEGERKRLQLGVRLARRGAWLARFGLVRAALDALAAGGRWFPQLAARVSGRQGTTAVAKLVGEVQKLPPEVLPTIRAHWSDPKCFRALAQYLDCLPDCAVYAAGVSAAHIPTIILSASTATEEELKEREEWIRETGAGRHTIVQNSGHWLHLEQPDLVIEAIRELSNRKNLAAGPR